MKVRYNIAGQIWPVRNWWKKIRWIWGNIFIELYRNLCQVFTSGQFKSPQRMQRLTFSADTVNSNRFNLIRPRRGYETIGEKILTSTDKFASIKSRFYCHRYLGWTRWQHPRNPQTLHRSFSCADAVHGAFGDFNHFNALDSDNWHLVDIWIIRWTDIDR